MTIDLVVGSGDNTNISSPAKTGERYRLNDPYWDAMTRTVESFL